MMDFVLVLHSHIPFVLGHGRWPHGGDWLMEAVLDSYLPLFDTLEVLHDEHVPSPVTLSVTPVLAAQLAMPEFGAEFHAFVRQRLTACDEAERELQGGVDAGLAPIVRFWRRHLLDAEAQFEALDGDLTSAIRRLEDEGQIELMSSAATHGFLPLLARDESVRLQLFAGRAEHQRIFRHDPAGCWLPECAYRPRGTWAPWPGGPRIARRAGLEDHLASGGYRYVVVDSHLARAGRPLEAYGHGPRVHPTPGVLRSPYRDYTIGVHSGAVHALVRDPESTYQVWSRDGGYPGSAPYLEFHKIRWPGGLKLWRVTGAGIDLGGKQPYDRARARAQATGHAQHFAGLLATTAHQTTSVDERVIVAPFDSELFGHWWFEGLDFLAELYRALDHHPGIRPSTALAHLHRSTTATPLDLPAGSWGRGGDFSIWLNWQTAWMWKRLWALEERFWTVAAESLALPPAAPVLAQAAREMLLAQSSDWPFIISTGEVADYGERRFLMHVEAAEWLVGALESGHDLAGAGERAGSLRERDALFPEVLDAVARSLSPAAAMV